jgi:hypothetical protein
MKILINSFLLLIAFLFFYSIKLTAQGLTWAKGITSVDGSAVGRGVAKDYISDGVYVAGYFSGTVNFDSIQLTSTGGVNDNDIFIASYNTSGKCVWAKKAGGLSMDGALAISSDLNGNLYVTGYFSGTASFDTLNLTSFGATDIFIAMYDASGKCIWAKQAGGIYPDTAFGISAHYSYSSQYFYITGTFIGNASFGTFNLTSSDTVHTGIFIAKYDDSGNCLWAKKAGGTDGGISRSAAVTDSGYCYITGNFRGKALFDTLQLTSYGTDGLEDIFIAKYSPDGNCLWAKQAGGNGRDYGNSISTDSWGYAFITGSFQDTASFDSTQLISYGSDDIFMAEYDAQGKCLFATHSGGPGSDVGYGISVDLMEFIHVTGSFNGTADFNNNQIPSNGEDDIFIARYHEFGSLMEIITGGGAGNDAGYGIISTASIQACFITGSFNGPADIDQFHLTDKGAFLSESIGMEDGINNEKLIPNEYRLNQNYPNPFNPNTVISYSLPSASYVKLVLYNTLGQTIKVAVNGFKNAGNYSINFNASNLPSGIYFYKLEAGQFSQIKKMMLIK